MPLELLEKIGPQIVVPTNFWGNRAKNIVVTFHSLIMTLQPIYGPEIYIRKFSTKIYLGESTLPKITEVGIFSAHRIVFEQIFYVFQTQVAR